jgi:hypothetical protein
VRRQPVLQQLGLLRARTRVLRRRICLSGACYDMSSFSSRAGQAARLAEAAVILSWAQLRPAALCLPRSSQNYSGWYTYIFICHTHHLYINKVSIIVDRRTICKQS